MDVNTFLQTASATLIAVAWKVVGAPLLLWLLGRWLIAFGLRLMNRTLSRQHFDATLPATSKQACRSF